jgi:hypothetical protein
MQVTFQPLQLLSRVAAALVVALPLAALRVALDDYERQAIGKMTHQELIAFVNEVHAGSYLGAYLSAAIMLLVFIAAVEAAAFGIRLVVGLFGDRKSADVRDEEFVRAGANTFPSP